VQPISQEEKQLLAVQEELKRLDESIQSKCKTIKPNEIPDYFSHEFDNEESSTPQFEPVEEDVPEQIHGILSLTINISQHKYFCHPQVQATTF
jgi:hypothetical protein